MNHSFNTQIAKEIGIYPVVLLETIAKSITKEHFHDGCFFCETTERKPEESKTRRTKGIEL